MVIIIFGLLVLGVATALPAPKSPLVLRIDNNPEQSVVIENPADEEILPLDVEAGQRYSYYTRDFDRGTYEFGYDTGSQGGDDLNQYRHEYRRSDGTVLGRYAYKFGEVPLVVNYIVDKGGYRILQPGDIIALEPEVGPSEEQNVKARTSLEQLPTAVIGSSIGLPAIPIGATPLRRGINTFGYFMRE